MPVISATPHLETLTLTIIAEFAAPPQRVWDMYADAPQLEKVWGPPSHPAIFVDHELAIGKKTTYYMTGPDGQRFHGYWIITDIDEPRSFRFEDGFADAEFNPVPEMPASICDYRFEAIPTGTRATFVSDYASLEGLEMVLQMGVIEGATSAINQIDGLLAG
jgi:uncharacterized protein YndB with AHSA1/START domain